MFNLKTLSISSKSDDPLSPDYIPAVGMRIQDNKQLEILSCLSADFDTSTHEATAKKCNM